MKEELIQTLHPQADKTNKRISLSKYNFIRENILAILNDKELTHTELMEELFERVKDNFEGVSNGMEKQLNLIWRPEN
jgi:hypothetical protein